MAIPFLNNVDLNGNQVLNMRLQNVSSAPAALAGMLYYDTTGGVDRPRWYDPSSSLGSPGWRDIYPGTSTNVVHTAVVRDGFGNFSAGTITATLFSGTATQVQLANGQFLVGNGGNIGAATAKSSIPLSGFGAAAANVAMGSNRITGLADPVDPQDAATKAYVDATALGLDVKGSARLATAAALPTVTYNAGAKTLTATSNGILTVDGVSVVVGNRILVKNQGAGSQNGIYVVTNTGNGSSPFVLTRATDFDSSAEASPGSFAFVEEGNTYADTGWVMTANAPITLDTTSLTWAQFSGAGSYTAGNGLTLSGSTFHFAQSGAYTTNAIPYATSGSGIGFIAPGTSAQFVQANGAGVPGFVSISGDATVAAGGALTIANNAITTAKILDANVTFAKVQNLSANSVLGRSANSSGVSAPIAASLDGQVLRLSGTTLGFGAISLSSANAVSGTLQAGNGGTGSAFFAVSGPASSVKTYTLKNQSGTLPLFYAGQINGNASTTSFALSHNLNTRDIAVMVLQAGSPYAQVMTDVEATDGNNVTVRFASAPGVGTNYRVVVLGY